MSIKAYKSLRLNEYQMIRHTSQSHNFRSEKLVGFTLSPSGLVVTIETITDVYKLEMCNHKCINTGNKSITSKQSDSIRFRYTA